MTLERLHIDGYLQFADFDLTFAPGVNVLHGPNEAGKSTVLRFIRYVLFGPPTRIAQRGLPLAGGRFGGTLWFGSGLVLERFDKTVRLLEDGVPLPESELGQVIGTFDQASFDAVFAADLEGLRSLGALDDEALRRKLFASSVLGTTADLDTIERRWSERIHALGKKSRNGVVRGLERDLETAKDQLRSARQRAVELPARLRRLDELGQRITEADRATGEWSRRVEQLQAVLDAQDELAEWRNLEAWLAQHDRPAHSSAVWSHRLDELMQATQAVKAKRQELRRREAKRDACVRQRQTVEVDDRLLEAATPVDVLRQEIGTLPDLATLERHLLETRRAREQRLQDVGLANLGTLDLSLATIQEIQQLATVVPPPVDLAQRRQVLAAARSELADAEEHLASSPEAGTPGALQHRLPVVESADARAQQLTAQLASLSKELEVVGAERTAVLQGWTTMPMGDRARLSEVAGLVRDGAEAELTRRAERTSEARVVEQLVDAIERLSASEAVESLSASVVDWAQRRQVVREMWTKQQEVDERVRAATVALERKVDALPLFDSLEALAACRDISWPAVQDACRRASTGPAEGLSLVLMDEFPDRAALVEQKSQVRQLQDDLENTRRGRHATRAVLVVAACLALIVAVAVLVGLVWSATVSPVGLLLGLLLVCLVLGAGALEVYLGRRMATVTNRLAELGADDLEAFSERVHADLARLDLADLGQQEQGASRARRAERERAMVQLRDLVAPASGDVMPDVAVWADLAERLPALLDAFQRRDTLQTEVQATERYLSAWTREARAAAEALGEPVPTTVGAALALAERTADTLEARRQAVAVQKARAQERVTRCAELERKKLRLEQLSEPTVREQTAREAVADIGGTDIRKAAWTGWLEAGLQADSLATRAHELSVRLSALEADLDRERSLLEEAFVVCGVTTLAGVREAVSEAVERGRIRREAMRRVETVTAERDRLVLEVERLEERQLAHQEATDRLASRLAVAAWPATRPAGVELLTARLQSARDAVRAHDEASTAVEQGRERWSTWLAEAAELARTIGVEAPTLATASTWVERRREAVEHARIADTQRETLREQEVQLDLEVAEAQSLAEAADQELRTVREKVGVQTAEEAVEHRERARTWEQKHGAFQQMEGLLRATLGEVDLASVSGEDRALIDARVTDATTALAADRAALEDLREERARQQQVLEELQQTADVVESEGEVERLEEELRRARMELAELTLAMRWLKEEYGRYVRENQPAVLRRASALLESASEGTMVAVRQENDRLYVVGPDDKPREPSALSRGTCEMLYLVIRLALALAHAEHLRVPLLLDDVMVNQDPARAEEIARVIAEVGRHHQVVLMTCRPEMRDLMCAVDASTRVIELKRFAGRDAPVGASTAPPKPTKRTPSGSRDVVDCVVAWLGTADGWQQRQAIIEGAGLTDSEWSQFRSESAHDARITHNGRQRRGSAYRLAASIDAPTAGTPAS